MAARVEYRLLEGVNVRTRAVPLVVQEEFPAVLEVKTPTIGRTRSTPLSIPFQSLPNSLTNPTSRPWVNYGVPNINSRGYYDGQLALIPQGMIPYIVDTTKNFEEMKHDPTRTISGIGYVYTEKELESQWHMILYWRDLRNG